VSLPEFSVRRPVTVFMVTIAVTVFGAISWWNLPVELLPDLSYPTLTIQTEYEDAAPSSVEQFVTRPVEEAVGVTPGVRDLRSISRAGLSEVILEFDWDSEMDFKVMEVWEKVGLAELPREADRPRVLRYDPSLDPIMRLSFTGDRRLDDLRQVAERWIKPRLEAVTGIAAAKVRGGLDPEVQVLADEDRLAALGLTLDDLAQALRAENVNQPGGTLKDWGAVYLVRTLHEFEDLDQIRRTVVRETANGRVRVEDVATVRRGHRDREEIMHDAGQEAVEIALHREGSSNTIAVAAEVREELALLREEMSSDLALTVLTDQSAYISNAITSVGWAALWGGLLAVGVLYFFLRDVVSTVIIGVTIPVAVVATFLPMFKVGVSLNIMSLGGLALGLGMLVDNSIVVLEAIDRHRSLGLPRREAAFRGGSEVAGAVTAATLTTVAVFLPIVFVSGVAGQLFYDLAVTVCLSLVASLLLSLTLIPMVASIEVGAGRSLPPRTVLDYALAPLGKVGGRPLTAILLPLRLLGRLLLLVAGGLVLALRLLVVGASHVLGALWWCLAWLLHVVGLVPAWGVDALGRAYPSWLGHSLRWRWAVLPVAFGVFALALAGMTSLGTNLVPDLSQGEFAFRLRTAAGSTLENTADLVSRIEGLLDDDPRFERIFSVVGSLPSTASGRQTIGENLARIDFVVAGAARADAEQAAIRRVREVLDLFPSVEAELVHPSVLSVRPPIAVNVFSDDLDDLDAAAAKVAQALARIDGIADVATTSEPGNPEITIEIDRERAASLGLQAAPLGRSLRRQIRGEVVGQFREQEERIDIRLRAAADDRNRAEDVSALRVRLDNGQTIPISAIADVTLTQGPAAIHRSSGARVAQVSAKVTQADLGKKLEEVRSAIAGSPLPGGAVAEMSGQDRELKVSFDSLKLALALAIFMVYVVMAVQFESLRYPFVILLAVPLGLIGVVAALLVTGTSVSVLALIGAVMLAGIVVNNAIVLVDAINRRHHAEGDDLVAAIVAAGKERLRPILMTTTTTVLALLPMALGIGAGSELRRPMAITVIGGLSVATLLTLIVIPCLYHALTPAPEGASVASRGSSGVSEATP